MNLSKTGTNAGELAPQTLQFLNIITKEILRAENFKQIGKLPKFFFANDKKEIPQHNLEMWPGYLTTNRLVADGIFLNVDTCAKFINKTTILDMINEWSDRGKSKHQIQEIFNSGNLDMPRRTVITNYNTKSYQVDGLAYNVTPKTHTFKWKHKGVDQESNMIDYIKKMYGVKITAPDQPCLYVNYADQRIYLPVELCHEAALPENFTSDTRKMRDIDQYKIKNPNDRFKRISTLINKILNAPGFKTFDLELTH